MSRLWLGAVVLIAGCALFPTVQPGDDARAVKDAKGAPTRIVAQPGGGELWQYATQPFGITFINVLFDAHGRVSTVWDGLSDARRAQIAPGMTMAQVTERLGPHRSAETYALSGEAVWDWNVSNVGGPGTATYFNVHFRQGVVVRTSTSYEYPPDGALFGPIGFGAGHGSGLGIGIRLGR
ncbi:MAG: hypothetical protein KDE68_01430 [Rhodocyclaceae bacterium]|nr:hypothetical protein [Rhodocyclaceae bacterium]